MLLTLFYIFVAVCACFVILSLQIVRAHERKLARKTEAKALGEAVEDIPEEEFFTSPIYKAMEVIAHM